MAAVRLDPEAFRDPRFRILGGLLKTNEYDAMGRLVFVWSYCTEKQTHYLTKDVIAGLTHSENFADFMVAADLAEHFNEKIRVKGTKGRIEWLAKLRKNSRKGGAARKAKAKPEGYPDGSQKASQSEAKAKPEPSPLSLTLSPSLSFSPTLSKKQKERDMSAGASPAPSPSVDIVSIWNKNCGVLPKAERLTEKRQKLWRARWASNPDEGYWASVVGRLAASMFCAGNNDRGWRATIDFLLQPDTHVKAMEGKYDGVAPRKKTYAELREDHHRELYLKVEKGEA